MIFQPGDRVATLTNDPTLEGVVLERTIASEHGDLYLVDFGGWVGEMEVSEANLEPLQSLSPVEPQSMVPFSTVPLRRPN